MPRRTISRQAEEEYVVTSILKQRTRGGRQEFQVSWQGYDEATWEPFDHVSDTVAYQRWLDGGKGVTKVESEDEDFEADDDVPSDDQADDDFDPKLADKAERKSGRSSRFARLLTKLPSELKVLTFGQLTPKDLLSLARTNKALRAVFMSRKQSEGIWTRAERQWQVQGLPKFGEDLHGPRLAALVCDEPCHGCGEARAKVIDWRLRHRLCNLCGRALIVGKSKVKTYLPKFDRELLDCTPWTNRTYFSNTGGPVENAKYHYLPDLQRIEKEARAALRKGEETYDDWRAERTAEVERMQAEYEAAEDWFATHWKKLPLKQRLLPGSYKSHKANTGAGRGEEVIRRRALIGIRV